MNRLYSVVLLAMSLLACGPEGGPGDDGGADSGGAGDAGDAGVEIAPPDIPWLEEGAPPIALPVLTPCPEGWHEVLEVDPGGEMDVVTCDPYGTEPGGTAPDTCPAGQAHFPGDSGCTPVGAPCPTGDFPEGLPSDRAVLYVLAGAPPGGDGTEASPLSTITSGLALASPGTIIAIGKGVYDETLQLPAGVTLWGACAAQTRLTASSWGPSNLGVLTVASAETSVTNLWVGPADIPGIVVSGGRASLSLDGVIVDGAGAVGVGVTEGGSIDGHDVVVSDTRADAAGRFGNGAVVGASSTLDLRRTCFSRNREIAIFVIHEGSSVTLSDAVIRDTQAQESDGSAGRALDIQDGATVTIARALLSQNRELGVFASDNGTSLTVSDVVIRDTQGRQNDGAGGRAFNLQDGATATVMRTLFSRNRDTSAFAAGDGTSLTLSDVVIRDTQAQGSDGTGGRGLSLQAGVDATVTRTLLSRNRHIGVYASGEETSLTLSDVVVRDTQARESDGTGGRGLGMESGAMATVTSALFSRNRSIAVYAGGEGTSLMLSDVAIRDTQARLSDGKRGRGLNAEVGAVVTVARALFARNRELAVFASSDGTSLTASDVVIRETQAAEHDGTGGRGLSVQLGATATLTRAVLAQNHDVGVFAHSPRTAVELFDVVVAQTDAQACAETTCAEMPFGMGLVGTFGAGLTATRFAVRDGALCGVMVAEDSQVDLALGEVSGFQIGACLQVDGYSVARLTDRVRYVDNGNNLDATSLPVPEPASLVDATR